MAGDGRNEVGSSIRSRRYGPRRNVSPPPVLLGSSKLRLLRHLKACSGYKCYFCSCILLSQALEFWQVSTPNQTPQIPLFAMSSDLDTLIDMGFEQPKAELAVKQTGGRMQHQNSTHTESSNANCVFEQCKEL